MESTVCNLCGSAVFEHWLTAVDRLTDRPFTVVRCRRCWLRYTNPRPSLDEIEQYYAIHDIRPWPAQQARRWLRRRRARWSAAGLPPGRALEIGCGSGWMLEALKEAGWDVVGTERSEQAAAESRRLGLDVRAGDVAQCGFPAESFDLIILWHVLEHLHDPLATLTEVRRLMRLSGRLVIAVPNVDSWQARVAGRRWFHLDLPRHLYHFDPATLAAMLGQAGFQVQSWSCASLAYEYRGWWERLTGGTTSACATCVRAVLATPLAFSLSAIAAQRKAGAAMVVRAIPVRDHVCWVATIHPATFQSRILD